MLTDEILIEKAKKLLENEIGWGDSSTWTNKDFLELSEKIEQRTSVTLSHVTLKRIWGKVKYDSLPNIHTLDTMVQFIGYENWRDYKLKNSSEPGITNQPAPIIDREGQVETPVLPLQPKKSVFLSRRAIVIIAAVALSPCLLFFFPKEPKKIIPSDYSFSSKTVITQGLPNTVVFNFDATKSPYDSVSIQQSWDRNLRFNVSKNEHQHTCIYYVPDYFRAKLIVGNKIVQEHDLLIKTNGWLSLVEQSPVPVYFNTANMVTNGQISIPVDTLLSHNVKLQPGPPYVMFANVKDYGPVYSDDFDFETSVKNNYNEGAGICQDSRIYLLCEGTALWVPLSTKGCVSDLDIFFTQFQTSGKQEDLSAFGVDFSKFVKVRVECHNGKANIFIDGKLAYTISNKILRSKIIGIMYRFQGSGSVDYVKLSNSKTSYDEEFNGPVKK